MVKNMMYDTPAYSFINGGTRYTVYATKKTRYGQTGLLKTPGGMWVVANGMKRYTPMIDHEVEAIGRTDTTSWRIRKKLFGTTRKPPKPKRASGPSPGSAPPGLMMAGQKGKLKC